MARGLHLADERPWRGHVEQNGLFGPGPPITAPIGHVHSAAFEGLDKGSIVRPKARSGNQTKYELSDPRAEKTARSMTSRAPFRLSGRLTMSVKATAAFERFLK
jgi:hypothetical protein